VFQGTPAIAVRRDSLFRIASTLAPVREGLLALAALG